MYTKTVYFISQISTLKMGFRTVYFITPVDFISTVYFISPPPSRGLGSLLHKLFLYCARTYPSMKGEAFALSTFSLFDVPMWSDFFATLFWGFYVSFFSTSLFFWAKMTHPHPISPQIFIRHQR